MCRVRHDEERWAPMVLRCCLHSGLEVGTNKTGSEQWARAHDVSGDEPCLPPAPRHCIGGLPGGRHRDEVAAPQARRYGPGDAHDDAVWWWVV